MPTAVICSDIHGQFKTFDPKDMPEGDIFICAGDITNLGHEDAGEFYRSKEWMKEISDKFSVCIWIGGNHDIHMKETDYNFSNVHFIQNKSETILGVRFYGVSMSPCYNMPELAKSWVNMTSRPEVEEAAYALIPSNVQVLVSHSPPWQHLDSCGLLRTSKGKWEEEHIGSEPLLEFIKQEQPEVVICGHVHSAAGHALIGKTNVFNVACAYCQIELNDYIEADRERLLEI